MLYRAFTARELDTRELLTAFRTGFASVLFLLQLWHLFLPINAGALGLVATLGVIGLLRERCALRGWFDGRPWAGQSVGLFLASVWLAWTVNRSTGPITYNDSGMYHIPALEWSKAYAIVPGLANLHGRLAFNSSSLLYAAMIDQGPWSGRSFHVANTLLLMVFGLQSILAWSRLLPERARREAADVFDAVLFIPVLAVMLVGEVTSFDTDIVVAILLLLASSRIHRSLGARADGEDDVGRSHFAEVAILLGAAVCVKLSAVVLAGALFLVALWVYSPAFTRAGRRARVIRRSGTVRTRPGSSAFRSSSAVVAAAGAGGTRTITCLTPGAALP